jgi:hypothetical protein
MISWNIPQAKGELIATGGLASGGLFFLGDRDQKNEFLGIYDLLNVLVFVSQINASFQYRL